MKNWNLVSFLVIFLIFLDVYKAINSSITHDEAYTYLHYSSESILDIISNKNPTPNNHILNSLLVKLSVFLFGASELTVRLPNIISHLLYLIFSYRIFKMISPLNIIFFLILLNANPYLLDFFSLARGYGIAIGLMTMAFYFYCKYIQNSRSSDQILALLLIALASFANFALLNVFLILILVHNIFYFFIYKNRISFRNIWDANKTNLLITFIFFAAIFIPLKNVYSSILIDFELNIDGFWQNTVLSLLYSFAYNVSYQNILVLIFGILAVLLFLIFILISVKYILGKKEVTNSLKFMFLFGLTISFIIISSIIQKLLIGTPFLKGRFALFIYPLFIFMISFILIHFLDKPLKYLPKTILFVLAIIFSVHTSNAYNLNWYLEWSYDSNTKSMLKELDRVKSSEGSKISLGITWLFEPSINFYRNIWKIDWLMPVDREGNKPENDYFYLSQDDFETKIKSSTEIICQYSDNKNILLRNLKTPRVLITIKSCNNKYLSADGKLNDIIIANRDSAFTWEEFNLIDLGKNKYAFLSYKNKFFSAELGKDKEITATRDKMHEWEIFEITELGVNKIALKASNGKYLSLDNQSLQIFATADSIGKNEMFELILKK